MRPPQPDIAVRRAEFAVDRARLAGDEPALAAALHELGRVCLAEGRTDEAVAAMDRALALHRRLAAGDPRVHEPDLAVALSAWATLLEQHDDLPGALAADAEAVAILERHVVARPQLIRPQLAAVRFNQATALAHAGRDERAVSAAEAAAGLCGAILAAGGGLPAPEIHDLVRAVASFLDDRGHPVPAGDLLDALARPLRAAGDGRLAGTLHDLAVTHVHRDELDRAAELLIEAITCYRATRARRAHDADLAAALYLYAFVNGARGEDLEPALAAGEEAVERFGDLGHRDPLVCDAAAGEAASLDVVHALLLLLGRDGDADAVARRRAALI